MSKKLGSFIFGYFLHKPEKNVKFKFLELDAKYGKTECKNGFPDHEIVKNTNFKFNRKFFLKKIKFVLVS